MSKNFKPIILVAGDPKSIFLEIFFKSLKSQKIKNPLILIVNDKILLNQMKILKYKFKINKLNPKNIEYLQFIFLRGVKKTSRVAFAGLLRN